MEKCLKNLSRGDVIRLEFGDWDNWVVVIVDEVIITKGKHYNGNIKCHYRDGRTESMWGDPNEKIEVLGDKND